MDEVELEVVKKEINGFKLKIEKNELEKKSLMTENQKLCQTLNEVNKNLKGIQEIKKDSLNKIVSQEKQIKELFETHGKNKEKIKTLKNEKEQLKDALDRYYESISHY